MVENTLQQNTCWLITRAATQVRPHLMQLAEHYGLTTVQVYTLFSLEPESPVSMHAISQFLLCDASNVTGVVDRLVARMLITRQEDPHDRRVKTVQLTKKGMILREKLIQELTEKQPDALRDFTPSQHAALQDLLRKV